ncbi:lytic polysaccharide monooxygenase [Clostridium sp.]|uniref:fibronectin type III domain-containing protein n=1 Tax=Clostridium sp. TaxID=1506 RepID=UPI003F3D67CA
MLRNEKVRKLVKTGVLSFTFCTVLMGLNTLEGFAHGYITTSRAALAKYGHNTNAGNVQYEPQSVEGKGNFPQAGPQDGQLASAGIFLELDEQTESRWTRVPMKTGKNTFEWTLTAPHSTKEFKYYITKKDWNPNEAIKRSDLEEIANIDGYGKIPEKSVSHTINIPSDREGYHVILGVWEIEDTGNAFYQVVDVDLSSGVEDTQAPTAPTNLISNNQTSNSIELNWEKSTDNIGVSYYNIYRNNIKVGSSKTTKFIDTDLKADTEYEYIVKAVDNAGNESANSNTIKVKTNQVPEIDTEAPTAPQNLHSMGETESSIDLHWAKSTDNVGVKEYNVYRDGSLIITTESNRFKDTNLDANTEYKYTVEAIDQSGNVSQRSNELIIKTKEKVEENTTWDSDQIYLGGEIVTYNGLEYKAKWWTKGDVPGESDVWQLISQSVTTEWNFNIAYNQGDEVLFEGNRYIAKWWTKGDKPNISDVWRKVN